MTIQQPPLGPLERSAMRARTTRLVASCGLGSASVFALAMLGWRHLDLVLNGISALAAAAWGAAVFVFGILVSVVTLGQQDLGYDVLCWLFLMSWISCVIYKMDNSDDYADTLVSRLYYWSLIPHLALAICWGIHLFRWNESRPDASQIDVVLLWLLIVVSVLGSLFVTAGLICAGLACGAMRRISDGRPHPGRKQGTSAEPGDQVGGDQIACKQADPEAHLRIEEDWDQRFRRQARERERARREAKRED